MKPARILVPLTAAAAFAIPFAGINPANGAGLPHCGGQSAAPQPVPYDCVSQRTIDGTLFTATVHADGTHVTVVITLDAPRAVPTLTQVFHHEGVSGGTGPEDTGKGTIAAGGTSITLVDSSPCRDGQLDIKAVFTGRGDSRGRIGGPWIRNGVGCLDTTTIVTTPTTVPATSSPTSSPVTHPGSSPSTAATPVAPPATGVGGSLPATGADNDRLAAVGALAVVCGVLILATRRIKRNV